MGINLKSSKREQIESKLKEIEEAIDDCTFTNLNIIKDSFDLGWYNSEITENDYKRLTALGEKFQKNCDCWIRP
jgi:hypothetical protein